MTIAGLEVVLLNQVRDDFRVRLGRELVSFSDQLLLERQVVLNDSVVHDYDLAGAIAMWVRVFFRRTAVSCPARVPDTISAVERLQADYFFQIAQLAFRAPDLQPRAVPCHRDPRRIVSPIFQLPQSFNNDRDNLLLAHVSYNAAHRMFAP